ncbi:MAG: ATP-binding protein [Cyanobacteria bacterium P01_D01_bin.156]
MLSNSTDLQQRYQQLERENRILQKKLERSDATCLQLDDTTQKKEFLLRQVINELKESRSNLERQSHELKQALTELKQTQTQLVQAEKMSSLGHLVAGVAHEINNPVNFIHGNLAHIEKYAQELISFLQLYETHYPEPVAEIQAEAENIELAFLQSDLSKMLGSMKMGTNRIRQIVLSLRNFSRTDEAEFKAVDIHEGIDSTLLILQHRLKGQHKSPAIQVIRDYGELPLIQCYPSQINQAFMNILANAIDALEENRINQGFQESQKTSSEITIHTSLIDADWAKIVIADNGTGMSESVRQHIFDPFFTTKDVGKGTGMGMPISYQIITQKHGGRLDCFSILGEKTEFAIQIPVRQR